ncbi:MAG: hypothetical protein JWL90_1314 [Chthoniobacteraceae bacterium]|nr:hypothetical protein [Chthoniobacteraceae bacterium]
MQRISSISVLLSALAFVHVAAAHEAVPLEEARNAARKLTELYPLPADAPFKLELDTDKPRAIKGGYSGVMIVPDKRISSEAFVAAGKTITPVGELWALKVAIEDRGAAVKKEKLRVVSVGEGNERRQLSLFLLGVAKNAHDLPELLVFGKENEPLLHLALQKSATGKQPSSVEISARKRDDNSAILTINLPGEYIAELPMIKVSE